MADRPILFSGPMVRALLDGRKTQTRRILNPQPQADMGLIGIYAPGLTAVFGYETPDADCKVLLRYMPGDRLYVREAWAPLDALTHNDPGVQALADRGFYRADESTVKGEIARWRPGIHMPRWASRLTLIVTDVRVQRLQEISEDDALAEGVEVAVAPGAGRDVDIDGNFWLGGPARMFRDLWDSLNTDRGYGWDKNPWIVALSFTVHQQNIDAMEVA